jgi:hypothetical protein
MTKVPVRSLIVTSGGAAMVSWSGVGDVNESA